MRQLATHSNRAFLETFSNYLYAKKIETELEKNDDGRWFLWVLDDDNLEEAQADWSAYQADPEADQFKSGAKAGNQKFEEDRREAIAKQAKVIDGRTQVFGKSSGSGDAPFISFGLIVISIGLYVMTMYTGDNGVRLMNLFFISSTKEGFLPEVLHGQVWRLITPIFMHGSLLHIFFNLYWIYILGTRVEKHIGSIAFTVLVLASAIIPNLAQYMLKDPFFLGMSGVVYAVIGFAWLSQRLAPMVHFGIDTGLMIFATVWMVAGFVGLLPFMANWAHLGGLLVGLAAAFILNQTGHLLRPFKQ